MRLPAGHRGGVVEQDLEGDLGIRRPRRPDGLDGGVVVGAVADLLEHVVMRDKVALPNPVRALAAHMGEASDVPVHPDGHEMAANPGVGA